MNPPKLHSVEAYRFQCDDHQLAQQLFGPQHNNLRFIEDKLHVTINERGGVLQISGDKHPAELAHKVLEQLYGMLKTGMPVYHEDVDRAIKILSANQDAGLTEVYNKSIHIPARKKNIMPRSQNQRSYLEAMRQQDLVFGIGPAGTGKTYLAVAMAVHLLLTKRVSRIVLSRPAVEAGEKLGFLPGDMTEKVDPYLRPLYDALYDMVEHEKVMNYIETGVIEVAPLAFMRGRTLSNSFVILDEAQNCTIQQMKMVLTRIGTGSRAVVSGDVTQTDLPKGTESGLRDAERRLKEVQGIGFQYFDQQDVVRHELVARIIQAYDKPL